MLSLATNTGNPRTVPVRRPPHPGPFAEPMNPVGLRLVYHRTDPTPTGRTTNMVEAQMDGSLGIFVRPDGPVNHEVIRQVHSAILTAIGSGFRLFDGHLEKLDPQNSLTDGSSISSFKRDEKGGTWRMEFPAYPRDMASGWNYFAQIVVRSCFPAPNGQGQTQSILLRLEDLNLDVLSIRRRVTEVELSSFKPGEILESVQLEVRREEGSQVAPWGTTDIRRLDLDGLPPVWIKTTEVASPDSAAAFEILHPRSHPTFGAHEPHHDGVGEGVLVSDGAAML